MVHNTIFKDWGGIDLTDRMTNDMFMADLSKQNNILNFSKFIKYFIGSSINRVL